MFVCKTVIAVGSFNEISEFVIQLFESVIVQKYLPGPRLEIVSVYKLSLFILFVHKYVNGAIPPSYYIWNNWLDKKS